MRIHYTTLQGQLQDQGTVRDASDGHVEQPADQVSIRSLRILGESSRI